MPSSKDTKHQEKKVVGVRFSEDRIQKIEARAEAEDMNKSELIRQAVSHYLGDDTLGDRVNNLETAVKYLLEQSSPNNQTRYINSREYELLKQITDEDISK